MGEASLFSFQPFVTNHHRRNKKCSGKTKKQNLGDQIGIQLLVVKPNEQNESDKAMAQL